MKRFWIGAILLLVLLTMGICSTVAMGSFHRKLSRELDSISAAAMAEDWDRTQASLQQAHSYWLCHRRYVAAAASHKPIEEIDSLYSQLEIYLQRRDSMGFALCCTTLRHRTEALGEAQSINWWNLL